MGLTNETRANQWLPQQKHKQSKPTKIYLLSKVGSQQTKFFSDSLVFGDKVNIKVRVMEFKGQTANDRVDEFHPKSIEITDYGYSVTYKKIKYQLKGVPVNSVQLNCQYLAIYLN